MSRLIALVVLLFVALAAHAETRAWHFRVYLDDREIGQHRFTLNERGGERELRSEARFEVKLLAFTVYRYEHEATERWRDGCLRSLVSRTDDNGEREAVDWRARGEDCAMSFAYWNPRILQAERLLNTQTGKIVAVNVTAKGEDTIAVRGRAMRAKRYRLDGAQLQIDLWLAGDQWVGLESAVEGGRRLRYELL